MAPIETHRGVIYPWHLDHMGHMNVQFYTARFDEATWHFFSSIGITRSYLTLNKRAMVAVEQHTLYKQELFAGALIHITSVLIEAKPKTIRLMHRMYDTETGQEAASSELVGVHIDSEARRSVPLPSEILERIRAADVRDI